MDGSEELGCLISEAKLGSGASHDVDRTGEAAAFQSMHSVKSSCTQPCMGSSGVLWVFDVDSWGQGCTTDLIVFRWAYVLALT